jgi:hypothetical protein
MPSGLPGRVNYLSSVPNARVPTGIRVEYTRNGSSISTTPASYVVKYTVVVCLQARGRQEHGK